MHSTHFSGVAALMGPSCAQRIATCTGRCSNQVLYDNCHMHILALCLTGGNLCSNASVSRNETITTSNDRYHFLYIIHSQHSVCHAAFSMSSTPVHTHVLHEDVWHELYPAVSNPLNPGISNQSHSLNIDTIGSEIHNIQLCNGCSMRRKTRVANPF